LPVNSSSCNFYLHLAFRVEAGTALGTVRMHLTLYQRRKRTELQAMSTMLPMRLSLAKTILSTFLHLFLMVILVRFGT
jgi:hypothetical protein